MHWDTARCLLFTRRPIDRLDVPWFPNGRREILGKNCVFFALPDSSHQKNPALDSSTPQRQAFRRISYSEPLRAFRFKGASALHRAMTIAIGFHDRANCDVFSDVTLYCMKIFTKCSQRNFRPSAAVKNQGSALRHFRQIGAWSVHVADYSDDMRRTVSWKVPIVTKKVSEGSDSRYSPPDNRKFTVISVSTSTG